MGSTMFPEDDTRSRTSVGTVNVAATLTVPKAIELHHHIGGSRKQAHLQALRNYWVERVPEIKGIEILTPDDPARDGVVTSFRLPAMHNYAATQRMATLLLEKHRILTVARGHHRRQRCPRNAGAIQHSGGTRPPGSGPSHRKRTIPLSAGIHGKCR